MALSTPPPPDPTNSTTSTTTVTTTTRPLFPNPTPPPPTTTNLSSRHPTSHPYPPMYPAHHPSIPIRPSNNYLYPVASSGRGFLHRPPTPPNPSPALHYPLRPGPTTQLPFNNSTRPPFGFPDPGFPRTANLSHLLLGSSSTTAGNTGGPGVIRGVPVTSSHPKMAVPPNSIPDSNGYRDLRDKSRDDSFTIRDRKVRVPDNASIYALCRSWLKNGFPEETQPQYTDIVKSLPRPLPMAVQDAQSPENKDDEKEEEVEGPVEDLSSQELLRRHIKRAKKVRSRLREERLRRIARYKTRLALLLPPMVEQHFRNDTGGGN